MTPSLPHRGCSFLSSMLHSRLQILVSVKQYDSVHSLKLLMLDFHHWCTLMLLLEEVGNSQCTINVCSCRRTTFFQYLGSVAEALATLAWRS